MGTKCRQDVCESLPAQVEALCALLLALQIATIAANCFLATHGVVSGTWPGIALAVLWLVWILTLVRNFRLVRDCGPQAVRFGYSQRLINRPGLPVRAAFHLVINWSTLAITLLTILLVPTANSRVPVAALCILATAAVWTHFNLLHRKKNRMRNLLVSSSIALVLLLSAVYVIRTAS